MCLFSKWNVESSFFYPFPLCGYPQVFLNGDWYCGKGVGLVNITTSNGFRINFYVTHFVARYELDRKLDKFHSHRISQTIELIDFVRLTSSGCDAIVITGDFNLESDTESIELIKTALKLSDAWLDNSSVPKTIDIKELELQGCTCDRADNPYRNDLWTKHYGNGERLDYILYRAGQPDISSKHIPVSVDLVCTKCELDMRQVPNVPNNLHYSDHVGLVASFEIKPLEKKVIKEVNHDKTTKERLKMLYEYMDLQLQNGLKQCATGRNQFLILFIAMMILVFVNMLFINVSGDCHFLLSLVNKLMLVIGTFFGLISFWVTFVVRAHERKCLVNARQSISIQLARLRVN